MLRLRICRNRGMTRASSGTICTMRMSTSIDLRNRKRNRLTATAASSATTDDARTVPSATRTELRR